MKNVGNFAGGSPILLFSRVVSSRLPRPSTDYDRTTVAAATGDHLSEHWPVALLARSAELTQRSDKREDEVHPPPIHPLPPFPPPLCNLDRPHCAARRKTRDPPGRPAAAAQSFSTHL